MVRLGSLPAVLGSLPAILVSLAYAVYSAFSRSSSAKAAFIVSSYSLRLYETFRAARRLLLAGVVSSSEDEDELDELLSSEPINEFLKKGKFIQILNLIKFLSSPIACVACERTKLLRTEIRVTQNGSLFPHEQI